MAERLFQIKAKLAEAPAADDGGRPRPPRTKLLREALHVAQSVLPSRDRTKNGPEKAALLAVLGVLPVHVVALLVAMKSMTMARAFLEGGPDRVVFWAIYATTVLAAPLAVAYLSTLGLSLAFLVATRGSGSRVRQALVCPYCRDEVEQEGTVCCVRKGCGAFYHRECWDECAVQYGGCAIYGCSSKKSREVSAAGYVLQIGRLLVAALLFPPRVARAIRNADQGDGLRQIWMRARSATGKVVADETDGRHIASYKVGLYVFYLVLSYVLAIGAIEVLTPRGFWYWATNGRNVKATLLALFMGLPIALPWLIALPTTLVFFTLRAVAIAFRNKLAALTRADEGGGSVLGRLRSGLGGKKECC